MFSPLRLFCSGEKTLKSLELARIIVTTTLISGYKQQAVLADIPFRIDTQTVECLTP
jgi:hypothetical protein